MPTKGGSAKEPPPPRNDGAAGGGRGRGVGAAAALRALVAAETALHTRPPAAERQELRDAFVGEASSSWT